jgi:hypothetical protein
MKTELDNKDTTIRLLNREIFLMNKDNYDEDIENNGSNGSNKKRYSHGSNILNKIISSDIIGNSFFKTNKKRKNNELQNGILAEDNIFLTNKKKF